MMPAFFPSASAHIRSTRRVISAGAAGERHQQDAARVCAIDDKVRDTMRERIGLA
jgi:hypothetical protein